MSPRPSTGRGMTCTPTSSPTLRAAAAPASVAAFTEATSPRMSAVTRPASTFCQPTNVTFAVLTMASIASTIPTQPRVSTMPRASPDGADFAVIRRETLPDSASGGDGQRFKGSGVVGQPKAVRQIGDRACVIREYANAVAGPKRRRLRHAAGGVLLG